MRFTVGSVIEGEGESEFLPSIPSRVLAIGLLLIPVGWDMVRAVRLGNAQILIGAGDFLVAVSAVALLGWPALAAAAGLVRRPVLVAAAAVAASSPLGMWDARVDTLRAPIYLTAAALLLFGRGGWMRILFAIPPSVVGGLILTTTQFGTQDFWAVAGFVVLASVMLPNLLATSRPRLFWVPLALGGLPWAVVSVGGSSLLVRIIGSSLAGALAIWLTYLLVPRERRHLTALALGLLPVLAFYPFFLVVANESRCVSGQFLRSPSHAGFLLNTCSGQRASLMLLSLLILVSLASLLALLMRLTRRSELDDKNKARPHIQKAERVTRR